MDSTQSRGSTAGDGGRQEPQPALSVRLSRPCPTNPVQRGPRSGRMALPGLGWKGQVEARWLHPLPQFGKLQRSPVLTPRRQLRCSRARCCSWQWGPGRPSIRTDPEERGQEGGGTGRRHSRQLSKEGCGPGPWSLDKCGGEWTPACLLRVLPCPVSSPLYPCPAESWSQPRGGRAPPRLWAFPGGVRDGPLAVEAAGNCLSRLCWPWRAAGRGQAVPCVLPRLCSQLGPSPLRAPASLPVTFQGGW